MRLNRLDLTRYGKFTDGVLDFGDKPHGSPDLHVVYGPNEAGKSTSLDAILDLIFGIGTTSRYGFLHPYPTMRIGANVTVAGIDREFVRIKRPQNSLLDSEDRPLAETLIKADLGGIDRDAFSTMFSLDDDTLEKGGEGILASKGDLGQLLFSASAGLSELSRELLSIRTEADGFYKYRARSGVLSDLKAKLISLKTEREALDVQASDYARLVGEKVSFGRRYDEAVAERAGTQGRIDEIRRVLGALPPMTRLAAAKERLAALVEMPEAPESWGRELPELRKAEIEYDVKSRGLERAIFELEDRIVGLVVDDAALRMSSRMDELSNLRARYMTAQLDIPRISAKAADLSIDALLLRLGKPGEASPARLVLDAAHVGKLRGLIGSKSGVDANAVTASQELVKVARLLCEQRANLGGFAELTPEKIKAFELLATMIRTIPRSDEELGLRSLMRRREQTSATFTQTLARLLPWRGSGEELAAFACPTGSKIESWKSRHKQAEEVVRASNVDLDRLEAEARKLDAETGAVRGQAGDIDESAASAARAERNEAWTAHRNSLDAASADAFEAAMKTDDHLTSRRLLYFAEVGKLHQLGHRRAAVGAEIDTCRNRLQQASTELEKIKAEIGEYTASFTPGAAMEPSEFSEWLQRREDALRSHGEVQAIEMERAETRDRLNRSRRLLTDAMSRAGVSFDPDAEMGALIAACENVLDDYNAYDSTVQQLARLEKEESERREAANKAEAAASSWVATWKSLCGECWLDELDSVPGPESVTEILEILDLLATAIDAREGYLDRIQKMEKDQALFEEDVHRVCGILGIPCHGPPGELFHAIAERVKTAGLDQDRREKLQEDLKSLRAEERALSSSREVSAIRQRAMLDHFRVATLDEVESSLEIVTQRRELQDAILDLEHQLVEMTGASDILAVESLLSASDRTELERELATLKPLVEDQEARCHDLYHSKSKAVDALDAVGGDSKVAEIEEQRRTLLLEITESAGRYMEIRAGVAAAEHALRIYRDRHRSAMMARASSAFRTISRGAYEGVAAQPGKEAEVLIAVAAGGGSKAANELSKGARFQLYLALRVAGYHEFVTSRGSVPFLADDIMETFDDFRAEEAFKLFAEMAQHGQVIYFTHHRHLTEIARKVCSAVRVHNLDEVGTGRRLEVVAAE